MTETHWTRREKILQNTKKSTEKLPKTKQSDQMDEITRSLLTKNNKSYTNKTSLNEMTVRSELLINLNSSSNKKNYDAACQYFIKKLQKTIFLNGNAGWGEGTVKKLWDNKWIIKKIVWKRFGNFLRRGKFSTAHQINNFIISTWDTFENFTVIEVATWKNYSPQGNTTKINPQGQIIMVKFYTRNVWNDRLQTKKI